MRRTWLDAAEKRVARETRPRRSPFEVPPEDVAVDVAAADTSCTSVGELVCDARATWARRWLSWRSTGKAPLREAVIGSTTNHVAAELSNVSRGVLNAAPELTHKQLRDDAMRETEDPAFP